MAIFPTLDTGAVTQYPSGRRTSYSTNVTRFVDGKEQRFRELGRPVQRWAIRLRHVSEEELANIVSLFHAVEGQFGSFSFVDPWDGTEYPDCSFEQDTLESFGLADRKYATNLIIRSNT